MKYSFLSLLVVLVNQIYAQKVDTTVNRRVDSFINVSLDFKTKRDFTKALKTNADAEIVAIENLGKESAAYAKVCQNYGAIYFNQGNYEDAELKFLESINLREKILGQQHPDLAASLNSLGVLYLMVGDYDAAEPLLLRTREIREKSLGTKHLEYAAVLNNLAMLYNKLGQFDKSEVHYKESKEIRKQIFGSMHSEYASSLNNLAILYLDIGNYKLAEPLFLEAKMIRQKMLGEEHPEYASTLNNMGVMYWKLGNHEAATKYYLESMAIRKKILGERHPSYSASLNNLAIIYSEMGELEKAEKFYLESLHIIEKSKGKENSDYAWLLNNLAVNYKMRGEYNKSMPLLVETKLIREKVNGREHPDYASSLRNIADLNCKMDNIGEAESLYLEALRIMGLSLGEDHPDYANLLSTLADYYYSIGKITEVIPYLIKSVEIERGFIEQAAQYLSELEMAKYMENFVTGQIGCFTYAQRFNELTEVCYDNTLFYKGFLLNAVSQLSNIELKDSINFDRIRMLKSHHRRLAAEFVLPINERDSISISHLQEKANSLEKEIKRNVVGFSEVLKQVRWKDVQKKLINKGEAAIEFVHYEFAPDSFMYAALVILPNIEKPLFVLLFEEKQLTKLYLPKNDRHSREFLAQNYSRGASPILSGFDVGLYDLIWKPLNGILIDVKTIYYSPSGLLHRINFDAIPINKHEHLADRFQLVRLGSTRTLFVPGLTRIDSSNKALLFGGIQYNLDTTIIKLDTGAQNLLTSAEEVLSFSDVELGIKERGVEWGYLSGTEEEINGVFKLFEKTDFSIYKSSGESATEDYIKLVGKSKTSPRVLHIATHGFFFSDPKTSNDAMSDSNKKESVFKTSDYPMIRCGLVLAGGNYAWKNGKPYREGMDDGILTGYEISQMNLSNTELVVLSACETGLGDIQGNEGVYGLQRAFKIAGAKYLIMSLWQVPDKQTSLLMITFYRKWLEEKMTIPDAFHAAQKELRDMGLDPYQWAGFVLIE